MRLLESALAIPHNVRKSRHQFPPDELEELALAWLDNRITFTQFSTAIYGHSKSGSSAYALVANLLRRARAEGRLVIKPPH
jgi:hypothetical protein